MTHPWHPSVRVVDMHYMAPQRAASYVLLEGDQAAIIDNTNQAIPHLQAELALHGLSFDEVAYIIVTHVHLDHAGGTGRLMELCPNATLLAHTKAARHLINPERIISGSRAVYGDEVFRELYGEVLPCPEDRVRGIQDGEEITWGERTLRFEYALGHATHHFVIYDSKSDGVFTGDVLGVGRSEYLRPGPSFNFCATAPPEFDPEEARKAAQRVADSGAQWAFIAHFGPFDKLQDRAADVIDSINAMETIIQHAAESDVDDAGLPAWCMERIGEAMDAHLAARGIDSIEDRRSLDPDQFMNGLGLAHAARKLRQKQAV